MMFADGRWRPLEVLDEYGGSHVERERSDARQKVERVSAWSRVGRCTQGLNSCNKNAVDRASGQDGAEEEEFSSWRVEEERSVVASSFVTVAQATLKTTAGQGCGAWAGGQGTSR